MSEDVKLKPCPFCGDEPALDAAEVDEPSFSPEDQLAISWIVGCSCSAFLGPFHDDEEAITAWNTRTAANADVDRLVEALENTRKHLRNLQPALNGMARDILDDIIADQIDAALAAFKGQIK